MMKNVTISSSSFSQHLLSFFKKKPKKNIHLHHAWIWMASTTWHYQMSAMAQSLLAWVGTSTAGKYCARLQRHGGNIYSSYICLVSPYCLWAPSNAWPLAFFQLKWPLKATGSGTQRGWHWGRMWLHVRGLHEEKHLNGSCWKWRKWGGGGGWAVEQLP